MKRPEVGARQPASPGRSPAVRSSGRADMFGRRSDPVRLLAVAAADRLAIAQPALSRILARLEREFGGRLFELLPAGVRLTRLGALVVAHARRVLRDIKEGEEAVATAHAGASPTRALLRRDRQHRLRHGHLLRRAGPEPRDLAAWPWIDLDGPDKGEADDGRDRPSLAAVLDELRALTGGPVRAVVRLVPRLQYAHEAEKHANDPIQGDKDQARARRYYLWGRICAGVSSGMFLLGVVNPLLVNPYGARWCVNRPRFSHDFVSVSGCADCHRIEAPSIKSGTRRA